MRRLDVERYPLMVQRFAALGLAPNAALPADLPRPLLLTAADQQQELRARLQLHPQRPVLGLCPGAEFGPAKQWPASHYAALAQHYIGQGWQVVALGSARDQASAAAIRDVLTDQAANHYRDATGSTSLIDAVDLLALCRAVVSNDSGLMHIAAAVGSALVAVYGSTSPAFTPPLADRVAVAAIDLPCRPCFQRQCPLGHLNCLVQLGPDLVIRQLDGLLSALEARECN
jgi:heptosyltransferase-2